MPHPLGWALMRAGEELAGAGRRTEARRALSEAVEIGQRLGATPLVDRALAAGRRAHLRLSAAAPAPPPTSASPPASWTCCG